MAGYKKPCIHCGAFIEEDTRMCTSCGSMSPFGYLCPSCLRPIEKGQLLCAGCGEALYVSCPICGKHTFTQEKCEQCGSGLMIRCENRRCSALQFFRNTKCTACGKKLKNTIGKK